MRFLNKKTGRFITVHNSHIRVITEIIRSDQYYFIKDADFHEADHPRDLDGKFTAAGGGGGVGANLVTAPITTQVSPKAPEIPKELPAKSQIERKHQATEPKSPHKESQKHLAATFKESDLKSLTPEASAKLKSMYEKAAANKDKFDSTNQEIADLFGTKAAVVPLKNTERAVEKIIDAYEGDPSKIKDLLRTTIPVKSLGELNKAIETIKSKYGEPIKFRNLLDPNTKSLGGSGYRDINMVVEINGSYAELQINLPEMLEAKDKGHKFYEELRTLEVKGKTRKLTSKEKEFMAELNNKQKDLYEAAWSAITKS